MTRTDMVSWDIDLITKETLLNSLTMEALNNMTQKCFHRVILHKHDICGDIQLRRRPFQWVFIMCWPAVHQLSFALLLWQALPASQQHNRQACNSWWQKSVCPGLQDHSLLSTKCSVTSQHYSTHYAQHAIDPPTVLSYNWTANIFGWKKILCLEPWRALTWHIFYYRMRSSFQTWNIVQWLLYTLPDTTIQ